MSDRPKRLACTQFRIFVPLSTRWGDNDVYGHLNNTVYFELFDTAVNVLQVRADLLDPVNAAIVGLVVENRCTFFASLAFPDAIEVGVALEHVGRSSVCYRLAVFRVGETMAAAQGEFTHVYVERVTQKPVAVPDAVRAFLANL